MVFAQAVLEAVGAVTGCTANADGGEGVNVGFANWVGTLSCGLEGWFAICRRCC